MEQWEESDWEIIEKDWDENEEIDQNIKLESSNFDHN